MATNTANPQFAVNCHHCKYLRWFHLKIFAMIDSDLHDLETGHESSVEYDQD